MRAIGCLLVVSACYAPTNDVAPPMPAAAQALPSSPLDEPRVVCDMAKFSFTQQSGCANDGWVEFCADKAGAPVINALRGLAPGVSIEEGIIGRAGCNEGLEYFVSLPVAAADCVAPHGALTEPAWSRLCALSQVPETKHFVPGFAE